MITTILPISEVKPNPNNPRIVKDKKFKALVQSLKDFPEMMDAREIIVNLDHMILGGNVRYKAAKEAGWTEIPSKIVDWPEDKQREFVAKDNIGIGEWNWEQLANQYEAPELELWGLDLPADMGDDGEEKVERSKVPTISVTFESIEEMENAMVEISELANEFGGQAKTNM